MWDHCRWCPWQPLCSETPLTDREALSEKGREGEGGGMKGEEETFLSVLEEDREKAEGERRGGRYGSRASVFASRHFLS